MEKVQADEAPSEVLNPRLAAKERAKRRNQITAELFSEESRGILNDVTAAEVAYMVCIFPFFFSTLNLVIIAMLIMPVSCLDYQDKS